MDPYCADEEDVDKLRGHCVNVLGKMPRNDVYDIAFNSGITEEKPECKLLPIRFPSYGKSHLSFTSSLRLFLKCPAWIRKEGEVNHVSGVYLSSASDPKYYGSLVYILRFSQVERGLEVVSLFITHQWKLI